MAMRVQPRRIGVDVSKDTLEIAVEGERQILVLANRPEAIRAWVKTLGAEPVLFAIEPTNVFHLELLHAVHKAGHTVYLVDGYRLSRYRDSIGQRAKTDANDARLLLRYLRNEQQDLRPWSPPPKGYEQVQRLLRRRARLIHARTALKQSLSGVKELAKPSASLLKRIDQLDQLILKRINEAMCTLGWSDDQNRCQAIEGIGPITAIALAATFRRGAFSGADAFIAFLGLDVRVRDSGRLRGKRKLTKQGDPELRRLLYMAAMTACRSATWKPFYERMKARGMASTQALVALARKLARIAFALMKNQSQYQAKITKEACQAT